MARDGTGILEILREEGAHGLQRVVLRANRSRIWSLTRGGTVLNLHRAFGEAPREILADFAVIVRSAGSRSRSARGAGARSRGFRNAARSAAYRDAVRRVGAWPPVIREIGRIREEHRKDPAVGRKGGRCCATEGQREYLARLYRYLNRTRFGGRLPEEVALRLSNRMRSRLGQMVPGERDGKRAVAEIALNVDLMLRANDRERVETLLHEMAHAADFLFHGEVGHGPSWRRWAEVAGCTPRACTSHTIRRRGRRETTVTRVPPLPLAVRLTRAA